MHLIYIDESGNTGARKDPNQPLHLLAGLIVPEADIRGLEDAVDAIIWKHFMVASFAPDFELHGADLYSGNQNFKGIPARDRIAAVHDVLDAIAGTGSRVIWTCIDKMKQPSSWHPHQLAFMLLIERIEDYLRPNGFLGLVVADETKENEQKLIDNLKKYKKTSTGWGYRPTPIKQIVDSIHFVQSKNNLLIQCVDLIAYFALKHIRQNEAVFADFLALPSPQPTYADYLASIATPKRQVIDGLGRKIQGLTYNTKRYP